MLQSPLCKYYEMQFKIFVEFKFESKTFAKSFYVRNTGQLQFILKLLLFRSKNPNVPILNLPSYFYKLVRLIKKIKIRYIFLPFFYVA